MSPVLRCSHCKIVIGRNELMVVLRDGGAREVCRAHELDEQELPECYHLACYERAYSQTRHRLTREERSPRACAV